MMRRIAIATMLGLIFLTVLAVGQLLSPATTDAATFAVAQPTTTAPTPTSPATTSDLGSRVAGIEGEIARMDATLEQHVAALDSTIEQQERVLLGLGALLTAIVAFQTIFQFRQHRLEKVSVKETSEIMGVFKDTHQASVEQVAQVMNVITQTLESRLKAEQQAQEEKETLEDMIKGIERKTEGLLRFHNSFEAIIRKQRGEIEANAKTLAMTPRHGFRPLGERLRAFTRQVDDYKEHFEPIDEQPEELDVKVHYVRGIAAHYANEPETATRYLEGVTKTPYNGSEPKTDYDKRVANAYYYLGITQSNFAEDPTGSFDEALRRDPEDGDYLTRVVAAEARAMRGETDPARKASKEIVALIDAKFAGRRMEPVYRRLKSRAILVQANVEILERRADYEERIERLLAPVLKGDDRYYYAMITMAQACADRQPEKAKELFRDAYESIVSSNDLLMVTEVRSAVLLRMAAGLCCKQTGKPSLAGEHLEKAEGLLTSLPKMGSTSCSVFSVLSKKNESEETIRGHIGDIESDKVLL